MVTTTDTTQIITQPKIRAQNQPSLKRWLKHFFFLPAAKRYFSKTDMTAIAQAVTQAEHGHVGEIQVVIEGHIPCLQAYQQTPRRRAEQLFAELGVWDTAHNSGILLYLNLCEQQVELVVDRGICTETHTLAWEAICRTMVQQLKHSDYRAAVVDAVLAIGEVLDQFYMQHDDQDQNELGNEPIILG